MFEGSQSDINRFVIISLIPVGTPEDLNTEVRKYHSV